jgi:hypothetical protein
MVTSVQVHIYNHKGELIEKGSATKNAATLWTYMVKTDGVGCKIVATAFDMRGNQGMATVTVGGSVGI